MLCKNYCRFERADPMQNHGIIPVATRHFEQEHEDVDQNQYEHRWRASKLTVPRERGRIVTRWNRTGGAWMRSVRFQLAEQPDLLTQFGGGMQNLESHT